MSGLRERKKQRTRELIATTAARLFAEHGFDAVTIDAIAREAEVARQTVFNYFPSKESMLFDRDAELQEALVVAVRDRPAGMSLVEAMRGRTHAFWEQVGEVLDRGPLTHGFWHVVRATPSLQVYAIAMGARHAAAVAAEIASERDSDPADPVCASIARALCGVYDSAFAYGMERLEQLPDGMAPGAVLDDVLARADAAFDLLARGIDSGSQDSDL